MKGVCQPKLFQILKMQYMENNIIDYLFTNIPWFQEYITKLEIKENLTLPYVVISYLADYYFNSKNKTYLLLIEKFIDQLILKSKNDKQINDLVFSGFFESFAFDNLDKIKLFCWRLSKRGFTESTE